MKTRIITGSILSIIALVLLIIPLPAGLYVFQGVVLIISIIGAFELLNVFEKAKPFGILPKVLIIVLLVINYLNINILRETEVFRRIIEDTTLIGFNIHYLSLILITVLLLFTMTIFFTNFNTNDVGRSLIVIYYIGIGMSSIMILRVLGVKFLVYMLLIATLTDMFAYFIGVNFGKHKMAPIISPKKSWEGAIGGSVLSTIITATFALVYGHLFQQGTFLGETFNKNWQLTLLDSFPLFNESGMLVKVFVTIGISLFASIFSQIGDLVASKMKRSYDVKDFGKIFPGHGGVLDRFDSIMYVSMFLVSVFIVFAGISVL